MEVKILLCARDKGKCMAGDAVAADAAALSNGSSEMTKAVLRSHSLLA